MQSTKKDSPSFSRKDFCPFVVKTIEVQGNLYYGSACYNEKHNMIIACPSNKTIEFYNATTFKPQKGFETVKLNGFVTQMSYQSETDTYILGCLSGLIYTYNVSKNELKKLKWCEKAVRRVTFLDPTFSAFSLFDSRELYVGAFNDEDGILLEFDLKSVPSCGLHHLSKRNLLFIGLENGFVRVFQTNKLPYAKAICSGKTRLNVLAIESMSVNGKDYILTSSADCTVRIWHLDKGRMRLLKVIHCECTPHSMVYLEKYRIITVSYRSKYVKFFRFPCMKLERTVYLSGDGAHLFLMKEKNMIGVTNQKKDLIEIIQLGENFRKNQKG